MIAASFRRLNDNLIIFTLNILEFGQLELLDMPQY